MTNQVKTRRRYESPIRQEQARDTRRRVLEAARQLFLARGYIATPIGAIAQEAGVAAQTVYVTFGNKRTILAALMDLSLGGDDEPVGLLERPGPQRMRDEPDQRRQLRMMAHGIREILDRAGPLFEVVRAAAAADPEIAEMYRRLQDERLRNMTMVVGWVAEKRPLKEGITLADASDIVWTLTSADVHRLLRAERGWTGERYERWLGAALIESLLPREGESPYW